MGESRNRETMEAGGYESMERENHFRERLQSLTPTFLEMRDKMGIGKNIGFALLPKCHGSGETLGALPKIEVQGGIKKIQRSGPLLQTYYENLSEDEQRNILVMPEPEGEAMAVSICDPYDDWDNTAYSLIDAPDDIFIGLMAHELAHVFKSKLELPKRIRDILENRWEENGMPGKQRLDPNDEAETDIIASLFGYKYQIIAKIDLMAGRFNQRMETIIENHTKNKVHPSKWSDVRDCKYAISSLERRKEQVLKYC